MKAKLSALLLALVLAAIALPAQAQYTTLDDPALTPGNDADRIIITAAVVSSNQASKDFTSSHTYGLFTIDVTACVTCSISFQLQMQDPDGTWYAISSKAALVATGKARYLFGCIGQGGGAGGCYFGEVASITSSNNQPFPGRWRVSVSFNSGTSASYTVSGVTW